jgi:hypothetical protein
LLLPARRYTAFISGTDEGETEQSIINAYLLNLLMKYSRQIMETLEDVEALVINEELTMKTRGKTRLEREGEEVEGERKKGVEKQQKDVLARRWVQIRDIVKAAMRGLGG